MRYVYIEDKSSGTDMIQNLKNDMNIIAVQRNKDKFTRAQDALPYLVTGKVFLPEKASFIHDFKMELRSFTPLMTHKHDDQVDVLLDAVQIALMQPKKVAGTF
jgi:predicted phage terminase large subunit-like protein